MKWVLTLYNAVVFLSISLFVTLGCKQNTDLPYLGESAKDGEKTIYHVVDQWAMLNQDSVATTNDDLAGKIYVADFFFTSCPSICPRVTKEMLRIQDAIKGMEGVKLVSFTIDPKRDTPSRLKSYAQKIGADESRWTFLTGDKDKTFDIASSYFVAALEDPTSPGGFDHSGKIILVDKDGHVRSFSEGTDPDTTPKLINDIKTLLAQSGGK